jgi:hypothetical protein
MKRTILTYVCLFITSFTAFNILTHYYAKIKKPYPLNSPLLSKLSTYKQNKSHFNVIFFGDSRTYTNINNELFDSLSYCKSFNIAHWSNWFPTQYSMLLDLLPHVPEKTTLVWSIGHQNFSQALEGQPIPTVYPINNYFTEYFKWGFDYKSIFENMRNYTSLIALQPVWAINWKKDFLNARSLLITKNNRNGSLVHEIENLKKRESPFLRIKNHFQNNNNIERLEELKVNNLTTSAVLYWKQGNYTRIEIDTSFFREKQREDLIENPPIFKKIDIRYMKNFKNILKILSPYKEKINIVVNFFEEAPYRYDSKNRTKYKRLESEVVELLKSHKFNYFKVDFSKFNNSDYFDYNHMNHKGSIKFTKKLYKILNDKDAF